MSTYEVTFADLTDTAQRHMINWYKAHDKRYRAMSFTDVREEFLNDPAPLAIFEHDDEEGIIQSLG